MSWVFDFGDLELLYAMQVRQIQLYVYNVCMYVCAVLCVPVQMTNKYLSYVLPSLKEKARRESPPWKWIWNMM